MSNQTRVSGLRSNDEHHRAFAPEEKNQDALFAGVGVKISVFLTKQSDKLT